MATCPYCKRDGIDNRGLVPHVRMSADDAHGPQGELPDDAEERINDATTKDVQFVSFEDADVDDPEPEDTTPDDCPSCGGELYHFEGHEAIEWDGEVIGYGEEGDVLCLDCGELVEGEVNET